MVMPFCVKKILDSRENLCVAQTLALFAGAWMGRLINAGQKLRDVSQSLNTETYRLSSIGYLSWNDHPSRIFAEVKALVEKLDI